MNKLKQTVAGLVFLLALNALVYMGLNTGIGYTVITMGSLCIVELLLTFLFVRWLSTNKEKADESTESTPDPLDHIIELTNNP